MRGKINWKLTQKFAMFTLNIRCIVIFQTNICTNVKFNGNKWYKSDSGNIKQVELFFVW